MSGMNPVRVAAGIDPHMRTCGPLDVGSTDAGSPPLSADPPSLHSPILRAGLPVRMARHVNPSLRIAPSGRMASGSPPPASKPTARQDNAPCDAPEEVGWGPCEGRRQDGRPAGYQWHGCALLLLIPAVAAAENPNHLDLATQESVLQGQVIGPGFPSEGVSSGEGGVTANYLFYVRDIDGRAVLVVSESPPPDPGVTVEIRGLEERDPFAEQVLVELTRHTGGEHLDEWEVTSAGGEPLLDPTVAGGLPWLWVTGGMVLGSLPILALFAVQRSRDARILAAAPRDSPKLELPLHLHADHASESGTRRLGSGGRS